MLKVLSVASVLGLVGVAYFASSDAASLRDASAVSCPSSLALRDLVASSDLIAVGAMTVPPLSSEPPGHAEIPTIVATTLKGDSAGQEIVRLFTNDAPYHPSNAAVAASAGNQALLFLTRVDEGPVGLYFAGNTPTALQEASEANLDATRGEVARQEALTEAWRGDPTLPHYANVSRLIAQLGRVEGAEQQRVFDQLQALGPSAVRAIISQMDDRRPLRTQQLSLANRSPDAWETTRHYGPEQVVDGLDAVLNQMTGSSFGSIVNGGSDRERDAAVSAWRVYANDIACPN